MNFKKHYHLFTLVCDCRHVVQVTTNYSVGMALSTLSIHMATIDYVISRDNPTFIKTAWAYLKTAFVSIPMILFKTGSLAVIFSTLQYGGLVHVGVLFSMIWLTGACCAREGRKDWEIWLVFSGLNIFTTTLSVIKKSQLALMHGFPT